MAYLALHHGLLICIDDCGCVSMLAEAAEVRIGSAPSIFLPYEPKLD